jgi:hypothetical protein
MNIRNSEIKKQTKQRPFLIFLIAFTVLVFLTEPFYRDSLFRLSIDILTNMQNTINYDSCIPIFEYIATFLGTYRFYNIMLVIIYNYANIYKTFIYANIYILSLSLCAFLKVIYHSPMMYFSEYGKEIAINRIVCVAGWGNPATNSVTTTAVYLTLWRIVISNSRLRFKKHCKVLLLILCLIMIFFINACKFFARLFALNEIIFGMLLGFLIYFFAFHVVKVKMNNGRQLVNIINLPWFWYVLINLVIMIIFVIFYFTFSPSDENLLNYVSNINNSNCAYTSDNKRFNNEALLSFISIFSNIGTLLALKSEYYGIFEGNETNWRFFNFAKEENEDDSLLSRLSISRETQWNHTSLTSGLVRLVLNVICHVIFILPNFFVPSSLNIFVVIFVKVLIPWNIYNYLIFFVNKFLFKRMNLANKTIFTLSSEII